MAETNSAMRVLIGCEFSGVVREAFRARGHSAWSCDLLPAADGSPHHLQGDVREYLQAKRWDLGIFHPPCTYLCSSGMHWTTRGKRDPQLTDDALEFVRTLLDAPIPRIALENPVGAISTRIRPASQIIQPWQFGEDASKTTCLWLKALPLLYPTAIMPPKGWEMVRFAADMEPCKEGCGELWCALCQAHYTDCACIGPTEDDVTYRKRGGILFGTRTQPAPRMIWGNQTPSGQNKLGPSADRWAQRSETYRGIAAAMARQWGYRHARRLAEG